MTDDEIRRDVLARSGWEPHEIDRWLAENPNPRLLAEQNVVLAERLRDLGRAMWAQRAMFLTIYAVVAFGCAAWLLLH